MQTNLKAAPPKEQKVKVVRAFYYKGQPLAKDSTQTLPYLFAVEMRAANKCVFVEDEAPKAAASTAPSGASGSSQKAR